MRNYREAFLGCLICAMAAAALAIAFRGGSSIANVPFPFLLVVMMVASRFGAAAGVAGSLVAAAIFALYLFPPAGFAISDEAARTNLLWMVVGGVVSSLWFSPRPQVEAQSPQDPVLH